MESHLFRLYGKEAEQWMLLTPPERDHGIDEQMSGLSITPSDDLPIDGIRVLRI